MDNFEKHIRENTSQFNDKEVDKGKLWANISTELESDKPKVISILKSPMIKIAAGLLLLIGIAGVFKASLFNSKSFDESQYASKELFDIDMHYNALVAHQVALVKSNPNLTDEDKNEFLSFMDELDAEYELLRNELGENLDNERVLEAIVANYKKRIELIENLLKQINKSKVKAKENEYIL